MFIGMQPHTAQGERSYESDSVLYPRLSSQLERQRRNGDPMLLSGKVWLAMWGFEKFDRNACSVGNSNGASNIGVFFSGHAHDMGPAPDNKI